MIKKWFAMNLVMMLSISNVTFKCFLITSVLVSKSYSVASCLVILLLLYTHISMKDVKNLKTHFSLREIV